jgi:hypothetical protein
MSGMTRQTMIANELISLSSTGTTSITFVKTITLSTAGSSSITFTTQTIYLNKGVILDFSTVTSTSVSHPI